jgi:hypothetical protein
MTENARQFVYSIEPGESEDVFPLILRLFVPPDALIADLTYNRGVFWKQVETNGRLIRSDIDEIDGLDLRADMRFIPFRDGSIDCVVLDPPYGNNSTVPRRDGIQRSYNTKSCMTPAAIKSLYLDGITAAVPVLAPGGVLIVKCQSGVDGGKQHWLEWDVFAHGQALGLEAVDRIIMLPPARPAIRHPQSRQQHARKWGSTFWVFRKARDKRGKKNAGAGPFCKRVASPAPPPPKT